LPKLLNTVALLLLRYANACGSLPRAVADPERDFLGVPLGATLGPCPPAFASGWLMVRLLRMDALPRVLLMFGLERNNNWTGLVLAQADHPRVLLPIIFSNSCSTSWPGAWHSC
jgi:hypothetical protein